MNNQPKPVSLLSDAGWASDSVLIFENANHRDYIPDEWIAERRDHENSQIQELNEFDGTNNDELTFEEIESEMLAEFGSALEDVDEFQYVSPEKGYAKVGKNYYRFWVSGECKFVGDNYDDLADCVAFNE